MFMTFNKSRTGIGNIGRWAAAAAMTVAIAATGAVGQGVTGTMMIGTLTDVDLANDMGEIGWDWNAEEATLMLGGDYTGEPINIGSGSSDTIKIILDGDVDITSDAQTSIHANGALIIDAGDHALTLTAAGDDAYGLRAGGGIEITGGTVNISNVEGNLTMSAGTVEIDGDITGNVTVSGEDADVTIHGAVGGDLTVSDGAVVFTKIDDIEDIEDVVTGDVTHTGGTINGSEIIPPPPPVYTLTITAQPGGKIMIDDEAAPQNPFDTTVDENTVVTLTAVHDATYEFVGWFDSADEMIDDAPEITVTVVSDSSIIAKFVKAEIIIITTFEELKKIGNDPDYPLTWKYELANDIDAAASADMNGGAGWEPIGWRDVITQGGGIQQDVVDSSKAFSGTFDGKGFAVKNLFINRPDAGLEIPVGLFGYTHGATIRNLRVVETDITGNRHVGALVGRAHSTTIANCYSSGTVTGNSDDVGGLIGRIESTSSVSLSYSTTAVNGAANVGGLIGSSHRTTISESYALGSVTATTSTAGGFVGRMEVQGKIENSYAFGDVTGSNSGGFVGAQVTDVLLGDAGEITLSYSAGSVSGTGSGGFAGSHVNISHSRWDTERSGMTSGGSGPDASLIGMTTAQMTSVRHTETNPNQWDVTNDTSWGIANNYPHLKKMPTHTAIFEVTPYQPASYVGGTPISGGTVSGTAPRYAQTFNTGVPFRPVASAKSTIAESFVGWFIANAEGDTVDVSTLTADDYAALGFTAAVTGATLDGSTLSLTGVTFADTLTVEARFNVPTVTLTYIANTGGTVSMQDGEPTDTISIELLPGETGPEITAAEIPGYRFNAWNDLNNNAKRSDDAAIDMVFTAMFNPLPYTVRYRVDGGGARIESSNFPNSPQSTLERSFNFGTVITVTAFPRTGFEFVRWSDGIETNTRTDTVPVGGIDVIAEFAVVSILTPDRIIPPPLTIKEDATVIAPITIVAGQLTAGPNPATRREVVKLFWSGRGVVSGTLTLHDAAGNVVNKIRVTDNTIGVTEKRVIGTWDLTDIKGKPAAAGTYLLRGTLTTRDGKRERVSLIIGVR